MLRNVRKLKKVIRKAEPTPAATTPSPAPPLPATMPPAPVAASANTATTSTATVVQEVAVPFWKEIANFEPVAIYRFEECGWKPFVPKTRLRLVTSTTVASRHRMIAYDSMGKAIVNMSIHSGMGFKSVEQVRETGSCVTITFVGTNDAARGAEQFSIVAQVAVGKQLQQKLDELCRK